MKTLKIVGVVVLLALLVLAYAAPIGPLPGVLIGGNATAVPDKWGDTLPIHEIRLSVGDGIPRVVIIWVIQVDGDLHVVGASDSGWTQRIGSGAPVRVRLEDKTYDMHAAPATEDLQRILTAYVDKYRPDYPDIVAGFPSFEEAQDGFAVFRLSAREA